jgi:hypothetical protein
MQDGLCSRIKPLLLRARHILRTLGERAITVGFAGAQHNLLPRAGRLSTAAKKRLSYPPIGPTPNSCRPPAQRQRRSCRRNNFDEEGEATKRLKLLQNSDCERVGRNPTNTLIPHALVNNCLQPHNIHSCMHAKEQRVVFHRVREEKLCVDDAHC